MKRAGLVVFCAVLATAGSARAQARHLSLGADGALGAGDVTGAANVAVRYLAGQMRAGVLGDFGFRDGVDVIRPMATYEYNLRLEDDVRIWLGAAVGPSLSVRSSDIGLTGLVTLDLALPIVRRFAVDFIVRAGFDEGITYPSDHPTGIGQFALGVTFDL